ncbi:MAG: SDR family oxidoreductase [Nakamurella sp.]
MMSSFDLSGRTAVITGSSRGIGLAIAAGLAGAGARIVLNGINSDRLETTRAQLADKFGPELVHARVFDVTDPDQVSAGIDSIETGVGPIDILVNNAGLQHRQPLLDVSLADWNRVLTTDLTSAFLVGREVARHQLARGAGKIINICSVQTDLARPSIAPYTAAKGGLRNLTRAMTAEWAAGGLQINGIAPVYIHTEMTQALVDDKKFNDWILGRTPAARWGTVDDLVGPAVFFASSASDYVNGQVLFIDGGMTAVV